MLRPGRDNVILPFCEHQSRNALERKIVGFGSRTDETDFSRLSAQKSRERIPARIQSHARFPSERMDRRSIPEFLKKVGLHCFKHLGIEGSRGSMIHVDFPHPSNIRRLANIHKQKAPRGRIRGGLST